MKKQQLTKKRKRQLLTMFALAGMATSNAVGPTIALADTNKMSNNTETSVSQDNELPESSDILSQDVNENSSKVKSTDQAVNTTSTTESKQEEEQATKTTFSSAENEKNAVKSSESKVPNVETNGKTVDSKVQAEEGVFTVEHKTSNSLSMEVATASASIDPTTVKTIVIDGSATMGDADWSTLQTLNKRLSNVSSLTLKTPDQTIAPGGLSNASWIASLTAPNVTTIGNQAFVGVDNLQDVSLGITDTTQLANAFVDSKDTITSFTLNNVTETPDLSSSEIESKGFQRFSHLKEVNMENVTSIGKNTFCYVDSLTTINCPKVETIGSWAFFSQENKGSLTDLSGLSTAKVIKEDAFNGQVNLKKIDLPNVTSVAHRSFAYFTGTEINLPKLESMAFTVDDSSFYGAPNVEKVNLGITDTTQLASAFSSSKDSITSFTLNNVTETPDMKDKSPEKTFQSFSNLTTVIMENLKKVGEATFYNTKKLTQVNMPAVETIVDAAFEQSGLTNADFPNVTSIGAWAFAESALQTINAPKLESASDYAFGNTKLTEINFPNLETMSHGVNSPFKDVSTLTKVTLGIKDTTQLASDLASSKDSITSFTLNNVTETPDLDPSGSEDLTKGFCSFNHLKEVNMENVTSIGSKTFSYVDSLTTINCPKVETIGSWAFYSQISVGSLTDLSGLSTAKVIEKGAFDGQVNLKKIDLPNVTSVAQRSFSYFTGTEINLPKLESVANDSFYAAGHIEKVNLGITDMTKLVYVCASSRDSITSVTLNNVTSTPDLSSAEETATEGFGTFPNLMELNMPNLTDVGAYTFANVPTIPKTVFDAKDSEGNEVPGTVQTIGYKAFSGIKNQSVVKASQLLTLDNTAFEDSSVKVLLLPQGNIQERLVQKYFESNPNILGIVYGTKTVDVPVKINDKASFGQENVYNADTSGVGTTYQWSKEGNILANILPKYEIAHFTAGDSGTYTQSVQFNLDNEKSELYKVNDYNVHEPIAPAKAPELKPIYDTDKELSGVTSPNASVYLTDANGQLQLSMATADADGNFVLDLPSTYKAGTILYVKAHTEAGDSSIVQSVVRESIQVPVVNPVLEGDTAISGKGKAGNKIIVSDGINDLGNTTVKEDGIFSLTIPTATAGKQYKVYAMNKDNEKSDDVLVTVEGSQGTITPNAYHIGEANITGTYTGNVANIRFSLGGKYISRGGDFKDGKFTYYCGAGKIKVGNTVKLEAFDRNGKLLDTKTFKPEITNKATIVEPTYQVGTSQITGKYTGDVKKAKLTVNGKVVSWGGTFANGNMSYYVKVGTIKVGDKVTIQAYDQFDSPLSGQVAVSVVNEAGGTITSAVKKLGSTTIDGNYEGNVKAAKLQVNGKVISYGGTFKDGQFSYYVGQLAVKDTDVVTLTPLDANKLSVGEPVDVTIEKGDAKIAGLTYQLGTSQITGNYEGSPVKGQLLVNGKSISYGGTFASGKINYYVKAGVIKDEKAKVTMNFFDKDGNLIQDNVLVSIQKK